jgi:4'-phosphopantetheinyl transferase
MSVNRDTQQFLSELDGHLPAGEVHVWLASLDGKGANVTSLLSLLNLEEQQRAERFKVNAAREQFVVSRGLLRIVIAKYLKIDPRQVAFTIASSGKPELTGRSDLQFNLSHTEGLTAIGVTRLGRVGIDVERVHGKVNALELAGRFFSRKELDWLRLQPEAERISGFLTCWTAKEAYVKAHGEGLTVPLDRFATIPRPSDARLRLEVFEDPEESKRWLMWQMKLPAGFKGALAVEAEDGKLRVGQLPETFSFGPVSQET